MKINGYEVIPGANLRDADLQEANLEGVNLKGITLSPDMIWKFAKELSKAKNLDKVILKA